MNGRSGRVRRPPWRERLSIRQVRAAVLVSVVLGLVTAAILLVEDAREERRRIRATGAAAVALLEPAASRAAYTYDLELAETLARALEQLGPVLRFSVEDNLGRSLAGFRRPPSPLPFRWLTDAVFGAELSFRRTLRAPAYEGVPPSDPTLAIGALAVVFDTRVMAADLLGRSADLIGLGVARAALVGLVLSFVFYRMVTRPVVRLSERLAGLTIGSPARLVPDRGHEADELGLLTRQVNALVDRYDEADQARAAAGNQLAAAAASMPDGLAILDAEGRLAFANDRLAADLGAPAEAGAPLACTGELREALARVVAGKSGVETETELDDGRIVRLRAREIPGGGVVLLSTDVTERRRVDRRLAQSERLNAVGALAAGVAHDFRNLLATVQATCEVARARLPDPHLAAEPIEAALAAARRGRDLVDQISTFSRSERASRVTIDLVDAVEEALDLLAPALPADIEVTVQRPDQPVRIDANPAQIHQLVTNLVKNAADASSRDGSVFVQVATENGCAVLVVRDWGCGMDNHTLRRLSEPFFTTKPVGEGTGLGLAVVHGIMESLKGSIEFTSRPGLGATASVRIPLSSYMALKTSGTDLVQRPGQASSLP